MSLLTFTFGLFLLGAAGVYFLLPAAVQPRWLLLCSLFYYGCADWRYLPFLLLSAATVWLAGLALERKPDARLVPAAVLLLNLALLFAVKWLPRLAPALPALPPVLGISFYTLQAVSYLVDLKKGRITAQPDPLHLLLYLCWFPIVLQGPICRYGDLMPRLLKPHRFDPDRAASGLGLILWGLIRKLVIADRLAPLVAQVFDYYYTLSAVTLMAGAAAYAVQLYADFSGCVAICRGASRLFGIELPENFAAPYGADSIKEFWRRWHMSLSGWLRDYVYIPLGGSRAGAVTKYRNLVLTFLVSGLWHGAGAQYIAWGLLHGGYQAAGELTRPRRDALWAKTGRLKAIRPLLARCVTFLLVCVGWVLFRAHGLRNGLAMLLRMTVRFAPGPLELAPLTRPDLLLLAIGLALMAAVPRLPRVENRAMRWAIYLLGILAVAVFGVYGPGFSANQFLYMGF